MGVVKRLARSFDLGAEMQRKLVHICTGLYALTLPWLFPDRWPIYMLLALTLGVMLCLRIPRIANAGIGSTLHGVERQSYGDIFLALAVGLCLFFAEDQLYLYVLPIAVLTLADAAAALAGTSYGKRFFRVEDGQKSLEGCVVFFGVTLLLAIICLMLMTPFAPINIILLALMVAGFGTLVEAVSWRGFDNLFLPLGILVFLPVLVDPWQCNRVECGLVLRDRGDGDVLWVLLSGPCSQTNVHASCGACGSACGTCCDAGLGFRDER